jgi:surface antigen
MYNRECVSYTAWKVASTGRYVPHFGGAGNANQWPASARADGIATGSTPKVGSAAVMYVGYYGHVMYVEGINSNGTIHVSQFNWGVRGEYSEMDVNPSGLTFIYF